MGNDNIPETATDALARWDSGDVVWSVEMGGLGPGYEMAIQGLAFELIRHFAANAAILCDHAVVKAEVWRVVVAHDKLPWGGFTGAQVLMATNFAVVTCKRGYRAALSDPAVADRLILVCKKDLRH